MAGEQASSRSLQHRSGETTPATPKMENIASLLAMRVSEQLPGIIDQLLQDGYDPAAISWQLECSLTMANTGVPMQASRYPIAAVDLSGDFTTFSPSSAPFPSGHGVRNGTVGIAPQQEAMRMSSPLSASKSSNGNQAVAPAVIRPNKRRKTLAQRPAAIPDMITESSNGSMDLVQQHENQVVSPRKKRTSDNPAHQPSTLEKYISGVWESLYAGPKVDITEVMEQWQAIESDGQPKLLTDVEQEVARRSETGVCKSVLTHC